MLKVYSCYDEKTQSWMEPFVQMNRGSANRLIEDLVNDPKTLFSRYPGDFTFFEIGDWDQSKGEVVMYKTKVSLGVALEFKRSDSPIPQDVTRN